MTASYFDVDGTLVSSNLMHTAVWYMANDINPLRSAKQLGKLMLRGPRLLVAELADRRSFNELLFAVFRGTTEDRLHVLADEAYAWVMKDRIYKGARDIVSRAKDLGHEVVLVSGALDFMLERLAADL